MSARKVRRHKSVPKKTRDIAARPAADQLAGVDRYRAIPKFPLKEEQWNEVAKLSGIPRRALDAQHDIETALGLFMLSREDEFDRVPVRVIRKELRALSKDVRDLCDRVERLLDDPNVSMALTPLRISQAPWMKMELSVSQVRAVFRGLPKWFLFAAYSIDPDKPGPKADKLHWLVATLDAIRERVTGKKITRSYKDDASKNYIAYVCRIADSAVGDGTLELAMKERIKVRAVE
jgi:hypothetical protein